MRQLWRTGYMHNRARMIAASFLVKHLLIDWRRGEEWFWDTLCDADPASNPMGWQWVAGSGRRRRALISASSIRCCRRKSSIPTAPMSAAGFPKLAQLAAPHVHAPWRAPGEALASAGVVLGKTYPRPIVDHAARPRPRARGLRRDVGRLAGRLSRVSSAAAKAPAAF